jgi:hypothetical protein
MTASASVTPVRVLLVGLPRMLSEIVRELVATQSDIAIAEAMDPQVSVRELDRTGAHVVICARERRDECRALLWVRPRLKVISVSGEGRDAELHELRPHEHLLGNLAPERLLAVIRSAAARPQGNATERC